MNILFNVKKYNNPLSYILFFSGTLFVSLLVRKSLNDDAYIFFRYARNIADGNGWCFNPGEHINALTSVLYPVILVIFGILHFKIQGAGYIFYLLFLFLSSILLYHLLKKENWLLAAWVAPFLVLFHSSLSVSVGLETTLNLFLLLLIFYCYLEKKYTKTSILLGLLILTRYDGILLSFVLLCHYCITQKRFPLKQILILLAIIFPWFCFSYFYFHSFLPTTLRTKMALGEFLNHNRYFNFWGRFKWTFVNALPRSILEWEQTIWISKLYLYAVLILAGIAYLKYWKSQFLRLLTAWILLYSAAYASLNVPFEYVWYWVPQVLFLSILVGLGLQGLYDYCLKYKNKMSYIGTILVLILTIIFISTEAWTLSYVFHTKFPGPRENAYKVVGLWLNKNTPPQAVVSMEDIGVMGYYSNRKIVDLFGLATPKVINYYQQGDLAGGVRAYLPDFMIVHPPPPIEFCNAFLKDTTLANQYQIVTTFYFPTYRTIQIYKKIHS